MKTTAGAPALVMSVFGFSVKHPQRHFQAMPMTARWRHTQVKMRFFQMSQECLSLTGNSHHNPQRGPR